MVVLTSMDKISQKVAEILLAASIRFNLGLFWNWNNERTHFMQSGDPDLNVDTGL